MTNCWLLCFCLVLRALGLHITSKNTSLIYLIFLWSFVAGDIGELMLLGVEWCFNLQFQTLMVRNLEICRAIIAMSVFCGWFGHLIVLCLVLPLKCCDWRDTSLSLQTKQYGRICRHKYTHKSAYMFCKQKHTFNTVQSCVCLVWDPSQASHIPHNTRAGAGTRHSKVGYPTDFWSPAVQI